MLWSLFSSDSGVAVCKTFYCVVHLTKFRYDVKITEFPESNITNIELYNGRPLSLRDKFKWFS